MKFTISKDRRTLTILADAKERKLLRAGWDNPGETKIESDKAMLEFFEPLICNSELEWINPAETGDLTSAPMLGIFGEERPFNKEDATIPHRVTGPNMLQEIEARWAFMDYQVRSVLEDLRDTGKAVFVGGDLTALQTTWFVGPTRTRMMIPTTPVCRKSKTGATMIIGAFDNRRDAILAAAAPELLSALESLMETANIAAMCQTQPCLAQARAALFKAKGNQ